MSLSCGTIQPGLVVEVANPFAKGYVPGEVEPFWQASIVKVMGTKPFYLLNLLFKESIQYIFVKFTF